MRVNVYSEELTDRIEIVEKTTPEGTFTGLRFYLELPVKPGADSEQIRGPFIHHPGDDDSAAVTFWGKQQLRELLQKALTLLEEHYAQRVTPAEQAVAIPCPDDRSRQLESFLRNDIKAAREVQGFSAAKAASPWRLEPIAVKYNAESIAPPLGYSEVKRIVSLVSAEYA